MDEKISNCQDISRSTWTLSGPADSDGFPATLVSANYAAIQATSADPTWSLAWNAEDIKWVAGSQVRRRLLAAHERVRHLIEKVAQESGHGRYIEPRLRRIQRRGSIRVTGDVPEASPAASLWLDKSSAL